jgi:hypothetical protein
MQKVVQIARDVATANLTSEAVRAVLSEPFTDSEGVQSIRITIVLSPGFPDQIKGDDALNTLVGIQRNLLKEGEERFPLVEYATEEELEESGDA